MKNTETACDICGTAFRDHARCQGCSILVGAGHHEPLLYGDYCADCTRRRMKPLGLIRRAAGAAGYEPRQGYYKTKRKGYFMTTRPGRPATGDTQPLSIHDLHDWIERARAALPDDDPTGALDDALADCRRTRRWLAEHEHEWEVR